MSVGLIRHSVFVLAAFGGIKVLLWIKSHIGVSKHKVTRRVDGNADILSHPGPQQYPLPRGHLVAVFHIRVSYRLPYLSFHGNQASHSRDTIWPWRSKVKVKSTSVSAASSWLISLVVHIRPSYRLPSLSFHDNRASHSRDTICPWRSKVKVKVKYQGKKYPSQRSIQLTHFIFVSQQLDQPFKIWQI